eukprot:CCRYP_008413-RA/>CCRYP_008413-RA protein AED:0.32 eAED:0.32 QI:0/0/0/1/0/0/2/0/378
MGKHATTLPFPLLSPTAAAADSFDDFPTSLMSVGKTSDDGTISIFTKDGVTIHKEQDVLITCHGPLPHTTLSNTAANGNHGSLQKAHAVLNQAHSVYDLPSTEQAIKWMHAVCGYPSNPLGSRPSKQATLSAGHSSPSRMSTSTTLTPPRCPRDTSTRHARTPLYQAQIGTLQEVHSTQLRAAKSKTFTPLPTRCGTIFTDQTGQFPPRHRPATSTSWSWSKSTAAPSLSNPSRTATDAELTRQILPSCSDHGAGIVPRKHVLDNKISAYERPHPGHLQNVARIGSTRCHTPQRRRVAIRNFKSHFLSILAGVADDFPLKLWDKLLPQTEITLNLLRQSNATPLSPPRHASQRPFDYNKMPLAPMGCNAHVHEKTDSR